MNSNREAHVEHFAQGVKEGRHERTHVYVWTDPENGNKHDITDEVMAAAGPESDAETEARKIQRENDIPWRLASEFEEQCFQELAWASKYIGGHHYSAGYDDDGPGDELLLIRDDGKRYLVEIQVTVTPE